MGLRYYVKRKSRENGYFAGGLNLIIIRSPENDITNKIELICPSNSYSKITLILIKTLILFNKGIF